MIKMATWSVALISRIFVQASAIELAHIAERSRKSQEIMPSTAENIELVKIRATDQVAINIIEHVSCKFVKFVGKKSEIRGQKEIIRGS